ncbi:hypothetical protein [Streptomyces sp. URMC 123]|uniref:hypothetical protein n=1 Tax=Streptomyces sp. URMC 123 TaxID=3423403 RepID=UPI003F1AF1E1
MRVGITGHRGLSDALEQPLRQELAEIVGAYERDALIGVSCLADGPDAWFARAVLDHGGRIEAVVPAREYRDGLPDWHHETYDDLLRRASDVHHTGLETSTEHAHMVSGELLVGLVDELLAVWDGGPARGLGGTADVVAYARRVGVPVRVVWPAGATRD